MKKLLLLLVIISLTSTFSTYSQTQMLWSKPQQEYDANNFNQNQYDCPIWNDVFSIFDMYASQGVNDWIGYNNVVIKDFNGDGYCDLFFPFVAGGEKEKIPFKLFLYNPENGELVDRSELIANNVGNTSSRKVMSADFNGDDTLDFVVVSHPEALDADLSYLDVVMSNESGWEQINLSTVSRDGNEGYYHGVAVGDIDNDNDVDFLVGSGDVITEGIVAYSNDGSGNFTRSLPLLIGRENERTYSYTLELEDIDLDGCLDVIYWGGSGTRIVYGNCDGTFGEKVQEIEFGSFDNKMDFDFVDFDNDGDKDLTIIETDYTTFGWQLLFLKNMGLNDDGTVKYEELIDANADLITQNFYIDDGDGSNYGVPYIQFMDLNKDGIMDIIKTQPFLHDFSGRDYFQNWVLFGKENLKYKYVNYPIVTQIENFSDMKNEIEVMLLYDITYLPNVVNPWNEVPYDNFTMDNLRGTIDEWVVYYRQSAFGDKTLDGVKRVVLTEEEISKEFLGNNTFKYTFNFQPEFNGSDDIYARVTYVDENGIENVLSEQVQFSVEEFDYDGDGVPNISDTCPSTPSGATVDATGCSETQLNVDDWEIINNLKIYPNPTEDFVTLNGLTSEEVTLEVYTTIGNRLFSKNQAVNNESVVFSLKNYPVGVYIVKVVGNNNDIVEFKVIKK